MIISMPSTTTADINRRILQARKDGGVVALGRVMTLVIDATGADADFAIDTANVASREHPCRIIVMAPQDGDDDRLDAEIRVGGDAGASEVIVLRPSGEQVNHADTLVTPLLLPDAPIVAWWPAAVPSNASETGIGKMAQRRITDTKGEPNPGDTMCQLSRNYRDGDTDMAWTRLTRWRALLASALEQVTDQSVTKARVLGDPNSASILLLGAWLQSALNCEIELSYDDKLAGIHSIVLETPSGEIGIARPDGNHATLTQPRQPDHVIALPARTLGDCLAEELRRLDADLVYGDVLKFYKENR